VLDHEDAVQLGEAVWRVDEHIDDRFAVLDAEPNSLVTGGVRDEEEGGGVRVAGVGQALSEFEDGEPVDRDAGEFHAAPNMTCAYW
jgi:hypothetical protein